MSKKIFFRPFLVITIVLVGAMFYSLPYYVSKPGMAKELEPIIEVENGYSEKGSLMLTTVRMGRANIYSYIGAKIGKYQEIYPIELILGNESEEEYSTRQLYMMQNSQHNAIEVAYKYAGIPVNYRYKGVYVLNVVKGMPAFGKLLAGDRIHKLDGKIFRSSEEFVKMIRSKKEGDEVSLTFERKGKNQTVKLQLKRFKSEPSTVGVGITPVDDKDIIVNPKVKVQTDEIGGPSAGLMFSLEIFNQLTKSDLTHGYDIAGTGTISPDGKVGPIGGISQKIIAADKSGAEIFLAPNEGGIKGSNYKEAVKTAEDIGTKMKIVPIDNFDEAVSYLEKLKEKKS